MRTNHKISKDGAGVSRISAYRMVMLLLAVLLLWAFCARPARAAGYWTVTELEGAALSTRHSGEKPRAIHNGENLPPGTFIQVRANSRVVFRSGDDVEVILAGQSRLLRSTNSNGYSLRASESRDSPQSEIPSRSVCETSVTNPNEARDFYRRRLSDLVARSRAEATELSGTRAAADTTSAGTRDMAGKPARRDVQVLGFVPPQLQPRAESPKAAETGRAGEPKGEAGTGAKTAESKGAGVAAGALNSGDRGPVEGSVAHPPRFISPGEALAVLRGEQLPGGAAEGHAGAARLEEKDKKVAKAGMPGRSVASSNLRDVAPSASVKPEGGETETGDVAAGWGVDAGTGRLEIVWPASGVAMVAAPTSVRLAWAPGVEPRTLTFRTGGIELLRVPLSSADREVTLPELAVLTEPGQEYTLAVEWADADGRRTASEAAFHLLSFAKRERMRQDLYYLVEALGPLWNGREGLMLRASVFAEFGCQSEAAELLLRYVTVAPEDKEVYFLLHHLLRASSQPDRAAAALALAN